MPRFLLAYTPPVSVYMYSSCIPHTWLYITRSWAVLCARRVQRTCTCMCISSDKSKQSIVRDHWLDCPHRNVCIHTLYMYTTLWTVIYILYKPLQFLCRGVAVIQCVCVCVLQQVEVPPNPVYCSERVSEYHRQEWLRGGPEALKHLLLYGVREEEEEEEEGGRLWLGLYPTPPGGLHAVRPLTGWPRIQIPGQRLLHWRLQVVLYNIMFYIHYTCTCTM